MSTEERREIINAVRRQLVDERRPSARARRSISRWSSAQSRWIASVAPTGGSNESIVYRNRREFLRSCCALGAAGLASQPRTASASSRRTRRRRSDYKALVCLLLLRRQRLQQHGRADRLALRRLPDDARAGRAGARQRVLLPLGSSGYGLHPALVNVQRLYNQSACRAGLQRRHAGAARRRRRRSTARTLPRNLYSHSDQTQQWQSSDPNGGGTGWGGRDQRRDRGDEHRRAAAGHHRQRRQRAVPLGPGHQEA